MARVVRWTMAFPLALLITTDVAQAMPSVDQQQNVIDSTVGGSVIGGGSAQQLAQLVTAGVSGFLTEVRFPVACDPGSSLIVEIQATGSGVPNGVILTSQTISGDNLPSFWPSPPSFRNLVLSSPVSFTAGEQFAIVLRSAGSCGVFRGPVADSYLRGNVYFDAAPNSPGWVCVCEFDGDRFDLPFQTLVEPVCAPPVIGRPSASPATLWPVNHKMVDVTVGYIVGGSCSASCTLNVASNEGPDGVGDGNTTRDWIVVHPHLVRLRAERAGASDGRVYTVAIVCTNGSGQTTSQIVSVTVPHD